jgi:hypothetical protein
VRLRIITARFAIPILRAAPSDRLSLLILEWLHHTDPQTAQYPPAVVDGSPAILPLKGSPLYFFPCLEQRGLLYQALFFHEFGHLLYACHKQEMDDLVADLQREVMESLLPSSRRNDRYAAKQIEQRQGIANVWYSWAQELFCDAVGWVIGGPCFLHAFSTFLNTLDHSDFYRPPEKLRLSAHPLTWLRVRLLADRAAASGFSKLGWQVVDEWRSVAQILGVREDYHGFYHEAIAPLLSRTITDMLVEAGPREYTEVEAAGGGWIPATDSPIRLLNWAWQVYSGDPAGYSTWEAEQITKFVPGAVR